MKEVKFIYPLSLKTWALGSGFPDPPEVSTVGSKQYKILSSAIEMRYLPKVMPCPFTTSQCLNYANAAPQLLPPRHPPSSHAANTRAVEPLGAYVRGYALSLYQQVSQTRRKRTWVVGWTVRGSGCSVYLVREDSHVRA